MTQASLYLLDISRRLAAAYGELPGVRAAMVTGSVARGESDRYSDIDMSIYYNELPDDDALEQIRVRNCGSARIWTMGDRKDGSIAEAYEVDGVQCQIVHATSANIDTTIDEVLLRHDPGSPMHKVMSGILDCLPLYGEELIDRWKRRVAAYPDELARAVVEKHLAFFPLWYLRDYLVPRDASLWVMQSLVEAAQNILGVLAGLNKTYYSTFQFKRTQSFIDELPIKPDHLYGRIELLFAPDRTRAAEELEALVQETVELVERYMPQVDTAKVRTRLGQRQQGWKYVRGASG